MNTRAKNQANSPAQTPSRHAVVLGGSLTGLLAARVLADHFEHVTLVERDSYKKPPNPAREFRSRTTCTDCWCADARFLKNSFPVCKTKWSQQEHRWSTWLMK